jgi:hypothetical protein
MIRQFFLAVTLSIIGLTAWAQATETSAPLTGNWNNVVTGAHPNDCCTGGSAPLYDPATGIIHFSYGLTAVHRVIAINQALSGSGVQINGYNWGYDLRNMNGVMGSQSGTDSIAVTTFMTNSNNQFLVQDDRHYNTQFDWTRFSGTVGLSSALSLANAGSLGIQFVSGDSGFWGGYYGPQVRNVEMTVNYSIDPCVSNPQSSPACFGYRTYYNISDDSHAIVPIPFGFPLYGKLFTHSIFFDNGAVSFYTPNQEPQRWGAGNTGGAINSNVGSQFHYSIMPLWTDLINYNGAHYTQQSNQHLKYTWENVSEFGNPNSSNTFSLEIRPSGFIGIQYDQIDVSWATTGMIGNSALGEFATYNSQTNWSVNETIATDCSNPLNNVNCPGYQQAYFDQQCGANALYSPSCPGYAQAFLSQQCSINTLYSTACPGYAIAFYDYQCSANALYHTGCPGYDDAYYVQQCNLDALHDSGCTGYAEAYAKKYIINADVIKVEVATTPIEEVAVQPVVEITASVSPADSTSPVQLVAEPAPTTVSTQTTTAVEAPKTEPVAPAPKTTRQAVTEQRMATTRSQAITAARENPNATTEAMNTAGNMEQQVELQNVVLGAMGFVAGFDAYGKTFIPDAVGYKPFTVYNNQTNVDNTRMLRGLSGASDIIHNQMIDSQYK